MAASKTGAELFAHTLSVIGQRADEELADILQMSGNPYLVVLLAAQAQRRQQWENHV